MLGTLYYARIYRSTDGGLNFASASTGITESNNSSTAPFNTVLHSWKGDATGNTVFTFVNAKVYKSTNYATSWSALGTTGLPTDIFIRGIGTAKSNGSVVGIVANAGRVFLTNNGGASWTQAGALPNNGLSTSDIEFDPTNPNTVYVTSVAPDGTKAHTWKSTNFGAPGRPSRTACPRASRSTPSPWTRAATPRCMPPPTWACTAPPTRALPGPASAPACRSST
jgi:hypothetical protein